MSKFKNLNDTVESLTTENESLKAENEKLSATLKQKTGDLEYAQRYHKQCSEEIDRCHQLLNMIPYAPVRKDEYDQMDLSVRIMGTLLAKSGIGIRTNNEIKGE